MKLAEALNQRADIQNKLTQLRERIEASASVQEGDQPDEDASSLIAEMARMIDQLDQLVYRINVTNQSTVLADGETITRKISRRDSLSKHVKLLNEIIASMRGNRYSRNEIKYVKLIDVAALRHQIDDISKRLREVDIQIQAANWTVDLI